MEGKQLKTKKGMAQRYQVHVRTVDNMIARGQIPFLRIGRKLIRFDPDECDRALQESFRIKAVTTSKRRAQ